MAHALTADNATGDADATLVAHHILIANALVLSAVTEVVCVPVVVVVVIVLCGK